MKAWGYLLSAALLAGAFLAGRWTKPCTAPESVRCDTVLTADTLLVPVVVPIERRVYVTADYRAEVEGYRPRLVSMELYRQTQVVTETPAARPQRWGIGIQAGYGLAPRTGRFEPYIGVGIQYSIWQW